MNSRSARNEISAKSSTDTGATGQQRDRQHAAHDPPGLDAVHGGWRPSLSHTRWWHVRARMMLTTLPAMRTRQDHADEPEQLPVNRDVHDGLRLSTASRARVKNAVFDSPGSRCSGAPKLMRLSCGTGKNSPFGMMRWRLWR